MRAKLLHHLYGRVLPAQGLALAFVLGSAVRPGITLAAFSASSAVTAEVSVADLSDGIELRALPLPPVPMDLGPPEPPPSGDRGPAEPPGPPEDDKEQPPPDRQVLPPVDAPVGHAGDAPAEPAPDQPDHPGQPADPPGRTDDPPGQRANPPGRPQPPDHPAPQPLRRVPPLLTADFNADTATLLVAGVRPGRPVLVAGGFLALAQGPLAANPNPGWQVRTAATEGLQVEALSAPVHMRDGDGDTGRSGIAVGIFILMPPGSGVGMYQGEITVSAANGWATRTVRLVVQVEPPGPPARPDPADPPGQDRQRDGAGPEGPSRDERAEGPRRSGHEDPTADQVAPAPGEAGEADLGGEPVRDSRHADPRLHDRRVHEHGNANPHPDEHRQD